MNRFLIRSGSTIYTIQNGQRIDLGNKTVNAELFRQSGFNDLPDGALLLGLPDPEVMYWTSLPAGTLPEITATASGTSPAPQVVITELIDMTDPSVIGIESMSAEASEDVLFAVSFDDGATWKAYEGNAWGTLEQEDSGMSAAQMQEISVDAWAEIKTSDNFRLRFVLPTQQSYFASARITYLNP